MLKLFACIVIGVILGDVIDSISNKIEKKANQNSNNITNEEESPFMYLPIKIKFNNRGPAAYLVSGEQVTRLDEDSIEMLDEIDIQSVDLDVRPYDWEVNDKTGRSAYLQAIEVIQNIDRFGAKYATKEEE